MARSARSTTSTSPRHRRGPDRAAPRAGDAVKRGRRLVETGWPALLVTAACAGIALSVWLRPPLAISALSAVAALAGALVMRDLGRLAMAAVALALVGLWWGTIRGDALDQATSPGRSAGRRPHALSSRGRPGGRRSRSGSPARPLPSARSASASECSSSSRRSARRPREPSSSSGATGRAARARDRLRRARLARATRRPRGAAGRRELACRRPAGRDRWRRRPVARARRGTLARGTSGERQRLLAGIVLGEDSEIDRGLRDAFQTSGLMHLLAVSGQNVAIVAIGVLFAARVLGLGRMVGEAITIVVVLSYALAVGWQPSVVRAAVAGTLASLAWIVARPRDRWHALAVGALVLLAWMPQSALEPGFQLSFAAVATIFLVVPRMSGVPEAYPVPRSSGTSWSSRSAAGSSRPRSCGSISDEWRSGPSRRTSPRSRRCRHSSRSPSPRPRSSRCRRVSRPHWRGSRAGAPGGSRSWRASSRVGRRRRSPRRLRSPSRPGSSRRCWSCGACRATSARRRSWPSPRSRSRSQSRRGQRARRRRGSRRAAFA